MPAAYVRVTLCQTGRVHHKLMFSLVFCGVHRPKTWSLQYPKCVQQKFYTSYFGVPLKCMDPLAGVRHNSVSMVTKYLQKFSWKTRMRGRKRSNFTSRWECHRDIICHFKPDFCMILQDIKISNIRFEHRSSWSIHPSIFPQIWWRAPEDSLAISRVWAAMMSFTLTDHFLRCKWVRAWAGNRYHEQHAVLSVPFHLTYFRTRNSSTLVPASNPVLPFLLLLPPRTRQEKKKGRQRGGGVRCWRFVSALPLLILYHLLSQL